jgi:hypothetical protein
MEDVHRVRVLGISSLALAGCAASAARLSPVDSALRGREIAVAVAQAPGGYRLEGRMRIAVPPGPLAALTTRPEDLVRLFPDRVAGAARWVLGAEERFYFAVHLFGHVFRATGTVWRELSDTGARVCWRTGRGARGCASGVPLGRGSEVTFEGFFPAQVDVARFLPGVGALVLRLVAFALRARIERLWREGRLPVEPAPARSARAGMAPLVPPRAGPVPRRQLR